MVGTDFARVERLLSSPARAAMLEVLLDGGAASASELRQRHRSSPSTASGHLERGWLMARGAAYVVPGVRERQFLEIGVDVADARRQRRNFAKPCLDWTERRPHLAGSLGAALAGAFSRPVGHAGAAAVGACL